MSFNSRLTTEKGLEAVGNIVVDRGLTLSLGAESELVQLLKRGHGKGHLNETSEGRQIEDWLMKASADFNIKRDQLTHHCYKGTCANRIFPSMSLDELLRNAIEYGSRFGELGPVEICGLVGRAIFLTIDDPGAGFDYEPFSRWFKWRRHAHALTYRRRMKGGDYRGRGFEGVNMFRDVDVWFERLANRFRTKLLFRKHGMTFSMELINGMLIMPGDTLTM